MSAKTQFLKKLQTLQPTPRTWASKSQADIAGFRQSMLELQEEMEEWLKETGISIENFTASLTELLVDRQPFTIPGIKLRFDDRQITFTPLFLYGQGFTGCVEVTLTAAGKTTTLSRLFMRSGKFNHWHCSNPAALSQPEAVFDEEAFFGMIGGLLP